MPSRRCTVPVPGQPLQSREESALRAFEFDHQAVAGVALHIADHEARALALAAREQVPLLPLLHAG